MLGPDQARSQDFAQGVASQNHLPPKFEFLFGFQPLYLEKSEKMAFYTNMQIPNIANNFLQEEAMPPPWPSPWLRPWPRESTEAHYEVNSLRTLRRPIS